jgi:hypothetical protein
MVLTVPLSLQEENIVVKMLVEVSENEELRKLFTSVRN